MSVTHRTFIRVLLIVSIALVSGSMNQTAHADAPSIVVTAVWHPGMQLSTIDKNGDHKTDPGDDLRYVDLELDVTTSVQFWAMELTCTVNKTALESYVQGSDPVGTGDDKEIVSLVNWTHPAIESSSISNSVIQPFNPATGAMTIAVGNDTNDPLGKDADTTSFPLATIRYRVKAVTAAMTSTVSCTGSFLDPDGRPVLVPTFVMPPALNIVPGYTISGNVSYQGRTAKSGIGVLCITEDELVSFNVKTDANGNFASNTRSQGIFNCLYLSNTSTHPDLAPDLYLGGTTTVPLNTLSYKLLPVVLPGGNLDRSAGSESEIGDSDLLLVTANYGNPVTAGDVNGDGKTDKSDLAIVTSNFGLSVGVPDSHILFGTTVGDASNGSRIWMAPALITKLTQQIPGTNADNWPAVSPDGTKIVVTRKLVTPGNTQYTLFIMNTDGTGTATQLTPTSGPNSNFDSFAASWSPDGSHIAFDCSDHRGLLRVFDDSALCVVDATGHGLRVLDNHVHIYPPAWINNDLLLYGGNSLNSVCHSAGELCRLFTGRPGSAQAYDLRSNLGHSDMPSISDGALFYRVRQAGNTVSAFIMADLGPDGQPAAKFGSATPPYNTEIFRCGCDYYTVRPGSRDIMVNSSSQNVYEEKIHGQNLSWGSFEFSLPDTQPDPSWDGVPESDSDIYALRNTFAWLP